MSLLAEIPGDSLKAFSLSLDALAGFGEELHIEAKKTQLILWSLNMSMTGQAIIRISPRFFEKYQQHRPVIGRSDSGPIKGESLKCRILLKTLRMILRKNQNITTSLDKCELQLTEADAQDDTTQDTARESRLNVKLVHQNGITKTHSLWYAETEPARALFKKETRHQFTVDPSLFTDYLVHFHPRVFDVALECTPASVKVKSYWNENSVGTNEDRPMHTEFTVNSSDFANYNVQGNVQIAFNMKEFKTALSFAEDVHGSISAHFDHPGKPIVFSVQQAEVMIADFAVMTHSEEPVPTQLVSDHSGASYGTT